MRSKLLLALLLTAAAGPALAAPHIGDTLRAKLAAAAPADRLEVIVVFDNTRGVSPAQRAALQAAGVTGGYFEYLPMAGVVATPAQVQRIAAIPGVRVLQHNDPLSHDLDESRLLGSVDQARLTAALRNRSGLPFSGKGVAILVNDSGIDGTHPDLKFGTKLVANAQGHTNLKSRSALLPFTPVEGVPNTDTLGSHGTHVAGIAAGSGHQSGGRFAGVANGASLIGYGSGATLLVLDTLGGFDYALRILDRNPEYNLRVVTNSFGNTGQIGQPFNPNDATNIATKMLADRGLIVVFSAGNSGSGQNTITGVFKKAPWVVVAGNGDKRGRLAPSSSRGPILGGVYEVTVGGETMLVEDRPTVVTTGTAVASARAVAADPLAAVALSGEAAALEPKDVPFYSIKTGTSMAAPHLAGMIAVLLEANPALKWREVKQILKATATNMSGYEAWEVGAGHANLQAALAMALALRGDYGLTNNLLRSTFNAAPVIVAGPGSTHSVNFMPVGATGSSTFEVGPDVSLVTASWTKPDTNPCTCAIALVDPAGRRYGSSVALPVLGASVSATGPGMEGTWTVTVRGIGGVSGVDVDPLDVTNGYAGPATVSNIRVATFRTQSFTGIDDTVGHDARGFIELGVRERLVDGRGNGQFLPDALLSRAELAEYLVMGFGVRQSFPLSGAGTFTDVETRLQPFAEAVTTSGTLLADRSKTSRPALVANRVAGRFDPSGAVTRETLAYSLVQAIGREAAARSFGCDLTVGYNDARLPIRDAADVTPALCGHVQVAIDLGLIPVQFFVEQPDPFEPAIVGARFAPQAAVTRADYTAAAVRSNLHFVNAALD